MVVVVGDADGWWWWWWWAAPVKTHSHAGFRALRGPRAEAGTDLLAVLLSLGLHPGPIADDVGGDVLVDVPE